MMDFLSLNWECKEEHTQQAGTEYRIMDLSFKKSDSCWILEKKILKYQSSYESETLALFYEICWNKLDSHLSWTNLGSCMK